MTVTPQQFRATIKRFRAEMTPARRRALRLRPNYRLRYPRRFEKALQIFIESQNEKLWLRFFPWFSSKIPQWKAERQRFRQDSWDTEVGLFLKELEKEFLLFQDSPTELGVDARKFTEKFTAVLLEWNRQEFGKALEKALGEVLFGSETWWEDVRQQWEQKFLQRTETVRRGFIQKLRETVFQGVTENKEFSTILTEIKAIGTTFVESKAEFIARDLTGLLNGLLQEQFNRSLGISLYIWHTMFDERVRGRPGGIYPKAIPSHWDMEGKICRWDNPLVYSSDGVTFVTRSEKMPKVHPGIDWLCRCLAAPFLAPIVNTLDQQIEGEENE